MAHGQPDFGMYTSKRTTYGLADMGELAARLQSIDTFDRRGDVVWLDDFEDNINKWDIALLGAGAGVTLSNDLARNGARSARLVTGNVLNDYAGITRLLPLPVLGKIGFEISFTSDEDLNTQRFYIRRFDGVDHHTGEVYYDAVANRLYYVDSTGAPQVLPLSTDLTASVTLFHTLKLVVDLSTDMYVRLILNEIEYDLSSYPLWVDDNLTPPMLAVNYWVRTQAAANQTVYADDAIVTQNEP